MQVSGDAEWVTPAFTPDYAGSSLKYARIGNVVTAQGSITRVTGNIPSSEYAVGSGGIPPQFRPVPSHVLVAGSGAGNARAKLDLRQDGSVYVASAPTGNTTYLGFHVTYLV